MKEQAHYGDGAWYDAEYVHVGGDVPGVVAWGAGLDVLELACGTGRLSFPLAESGAQVLGVDRSEGMLQAAEAKRVRAPAPIRNRLRFVLGDMRSVRLERRFERILVGLNGLMHMLDDPDLEAALSTIRHHLAPGGRALLDLFTPLPWGTEPAEPVDPQEMIDPRYGTRLEVSETRHTDPLRQVQTLRFHYRPVSAPAPTRWSEVQVRFMYPRETDAWLRWTGFQVVGDWEDLERSRPFQGTGGRRILEVEAALEGNGP